MKSQTASLREITGAATDEHIARLCAIPLLFDDTDRRPTVPARLADDSWQGSGGVGRRDLIDGHIRRVAFAAGEYRVELIAERRANQWEFVGRVYHRGRAQHHLVLAAGRKRFAADSGGFFHWTSAHAVRNLVLVSEHKRFALESIAW